jgi:hypothetical protein
VAKSRVRSVSLKNDSGAPGTGNSEMEARNILSPTNPGSFDAWKDAHNSDYTLGKYPSTASHQVYCSCVTVARTYFSNR